MGIGTQEIIKTCLVANMKEPEFFEQAGAFVVRLWSKHYKAAAELIDYSDLTSRQKKILEILKVHKKLSPYEILGQLQEDITDRTLRNDLQALKEKRYLDSEGKGPKTKWYFVEDPEINRK